METSEDKQWASKYLLDPLTAPEPSQEDGPGSHFVPSTPQHSKSEKQPSVSSYPTPPGSASPSRSSFHPSNPYAAKPASAHREQASAALKEGDASRRKSSDDKQSSAGRRRGSSLGERFPGDMSHRPLASVRKDAKMADRAPHLKKKHLPGADTIDNLDKSFLGMSYHHGGPYDATLLARNTSFQSSPVQALQSTNAEALKATPKEYVQDSLRKHVPLQGTSIIPPGMEGMDGRPMEYEEGDDLMRDADAPGGAYKRWEHVKYHPDDLKGKGEPSFTIDRALKDHDTAVRGHRRIMSDGDSAYEMQTPTTRRPTTTRLRSQSSGAYQSFAAGSSRSTPSSPAIGSSSGSAAASGAASGMGSGKPAGNSLRYAEFETDMRRSSSTGKKFGEGLRSRFGSLRRTKRGSDV